MTDKKTDCHELEEELRIAQLQLESRNATLETINHIIDTLHSSYDYNTVIEGAVDAMMKYSQSPSVGIFTVQPNAEHFKLELCKGFSENTREIAGRMPIKESLTGMALATKEVESSIRIASDDRLFPEAQQSLLDEGRQTAVSVPLLHKNEVIGVMNLLFQEQRILAAYEREALLSIGKTLALAMVNANHLARLGEEIAERKNAEEKLRKAHDELEQRVDERTKELLSINRLLRTEIKQRREVEHNLKVTEEKFLKSQQIKETSGLCDIIGKSKPMQTVFDIVERAAKSQAPVIIFGESGTGKELVAHAIHQLSDRKNEPYVKLNCAALNESLLESELFGHIKGAFTGAYRQRIGRFEAANGGDIFLDEIGDIPVQTQTKLLRVLETQQFERLGDQNPISVDVRIISATNKNLEQLISRKLFREDFYFRINVIPIYLPPLRERLEDLPLLIETFIRQLCLRTNKEIVGLSPSVMQCFTEYHWPGNIRELKSVLEYAFVLAKNEIIEMEQLPSRILSDTKNTVAGGKCVNNDEQEKRALLAALNQSKGNKSRAAKTLGVNRMTVWNRMKKHGIDLKTSVESQ